MNRPKEADSKSDWMVYAYHLEDLLQANELAATDSQHSNGAEPQAEITPYICSKIERCHNAGGKHCGSHQPCYTA